jgi:hypothetical protein
MGFVLISIKVHQVTLLKVIVTFEGGGVKRVVTLAVSVLLGDVLLIV